MKGRLVNGVKIAPATKFFASPKRNTEAPAKSAPRIVIINP